LANVAKVLSPLMKSEKGSFLVPLPPSLHRRNVGSSVLCVASHCMFYFVIVNKYHDVSLKKLPIARMLVRVMDDGTLCHRLSYWRRY
jgi:hypothetical protein